MKPISRRLLLRALPALGGLMWSNHALSLASARRAGSGQSRDQFAGAPLLPPAETLKRAQEAGRVNVALVPTDWANYAGFIEAFSRKFNLPVKVIDSQGDAKVVMNALRNSKELEAEAPDVIDVPFEFGSQAKRESLLAPYFAASWAKIPRFLKDAQGFWSGSHFGVMSFVVNTEAMAAPPQDWHNLLAPAFQNLVALAGDPRKSQLAAHTVLAAAVANGGQGNGQTGLNFFSQLKRVGNLLPTLATRDSLTSGKTPLSFRWDYHALQLRDALPNKIKVIVPKHGVLARTYVQAVNALAPSPYGARLWMDFLHSDEGQNLLLKGYARSTWFNDLAKRSAIDPEQLAKLPAQADYRATFFPSGAQIVNALKAIGENWDKVVGLNFET